MTENPPKPRVEVVEETAETLDVLDLDRTPRPEKMAREAEYVERGHEVAFHERDFVPRNPGTIDEIRAAVDALERKGVAFPEPRATLAPEPAIAAPPEVPERLRAPIEARSGRRVVAAQVVHEETAGEVVEATHEDGGKTLWVLADGAARPFDDVAARIDALAPPTIASAAEPATPETPAQAAAPQGAPQLKKGLLGRFGRKADDTSAAEKPASKRRFGLKRGGGER